MLRYYISQYGSYAISWKYTDRDCTGKSRHYQKRLSGRDYPAKSRGNGGDRSRGRKTACKALYRRCFQGNGGNRNVKRDQIRSSGTWNGDNPAYRDISGGELLSGGHCVKRRSWNCRPDHFRWNPKYRVAYFLLPADYFLLPVLFPAFRLSLSTGNPRFSLPRTQVLPLSSPSDYPV